jgi:chromosome segregation ATPase
LDAILVKKTKINAINSQIEEVQARKDQVEKAIQRKTEAMNAMKEKVAELKAVSSGAAKRITEMAAENVNLIVALNELAAINGSAAPRFDESEDPLQLVHQFIANNPLRKHVLQ